MPEPLRVVLLHPVVGHLSLTLGSDEGHACVRCGTSKRVVDVQCERCGAVMCDACYWRGAPEGERERFDALDSNYIQRMAEAGIGLYVFMCSRCRS